MLPLSVFKMLQGKKILLGITGSIAAYKAAFLVRLLVKEGAEVQVVMTPSAVSFITPLTLATLSGRPVLTELSDKDQWSNHVMLGRWADLMIVAPASANTLAKMEAGICDNLLLAVYLSANCPVMIAPAMDSDMWAHPATRQNIVALTERGHVFLPVGTGPLASGLTGEGRLPEPEEILAAVVERFGAGVGLLAGKRALVTAGPTYEPLDPVRFIGNHSSGKMGIALAEELAAQGCAVDLVLGPGCLVPAHQAITIHRVTTAEEMYQRCLALFPDTDVVLMAAAVADYRPSVPSEKKIKKKEDSFTLSLERTPDILRELGSRKQPGQFLGGFALETDQEEVHARQKLVEKHLDMIVLNSLNDPGAGFREDTNKVTIFTAAGGRVAFPLKSKKAVARDIVGLVAEAMGDNGVN